MRFLKTFNKKKNSLWSHFFSIKSSEWVFQRHENFYSDSLRRSLRVDVFLPPAYQKKVRKYPLLLFNDGQDMEAIQMKKQLEEAYKQKKVRPFILAAVHAGERMQEYGVTSRPDYKKRGSKARAYGQFITQELIPILLQRYPALKPSGDWAIAGFSLGGLSAFDLAWNYPRFFSKVGVFSGSFWWRSKAFRPEEPDGNRIMHEVVSQSVRRDGLQFWLQTGTQDENEDRNNNGVIDSIDDTLDLIQELEKLGYQSGADIQYVEVEGGEHNHRTWGEVMPVFLAWAFPRQ